MILYFAVCIPQDNFRKRKDELFLGMSGFSALFTRKMHDSPEAPLA